MNANILAEALFNIQRKACVNTYDAEAMRNALEGISELVRTYNEIAWEHDAHTYILTINNLGEMKEITFASIKEVNWYIKNANVTPVHLEKVDAKGGITHIKDYE